MPSTRWTSSHLSVSEALTMAATFIIEPQEVETLNGAQWQVLPDVVSDNFQVGNKSKMLTSTRPSQPTHRMQQ